IDQHLLVRERQDDLVAVVAAKPRLLGIGIDEMTAVIVQGDRLTVIGRSVAGIYDGQDHEGKRYYLLHRGEQFDVRPRLRVPGGRVDRSGQILKVARQREPVPAAKSALDRDILAHADSAWEMALKIWEWAEVGYQEKRSAALLAGAM